MKQKTSYVIMKVIPNSIRDDWDIFCVCEDKKTADKECYLKNGRARYCSYFVKPVPFIAANA